MKKFKFKQITVAIILFFTLFNTISVYAAGGDGTGNGSGGDDKPLNFVSCTLDDGTSSGGKIDTPEGITINPKFELTFDKNVVNDLVWVNNSKCITIVTDSNSDVPIYVRKIDDTVDFSSRQIIFIRPVNVLQSGKTYFIKVAPGLKAKNMITLAGSTNGKGITITFVTKKDGNSVSTSATSSAANTKTPITATPKGQGGAKNIFSSLSFNNWIAIVILILIVIWILIEINTNRKNGKERRTKPKV